MKKSRSVPPDPYVELAKAAIRAFVERGEVLQADGCKCAGGSVGNSGSGSGSGGSGGSSGSGGIYEPLLRDRAGVFVSIKKNGELRGCIGTISPVGENIAEEIIQNAISSCSHDPRFNPIGPEELPSLSVSVDVLSEPEPVKSVSELDVRRYGVIVSKGFRRGLLLPNLEGVNTVDYQLRIALDKAGIGYKETYAIQRFEVVRHDAGGMLNDEYRP